MHLTKMRLGYSSSGNAEVNADASNWFSPNLQALDIMVRRAGFKIMEFINFWDVNTRERLDGDAGMRAVKNGRAVVHLYK
jgi:hypothetical protein